MCHLNRYSVLTEYSLTGTPEVTYFVCLTSKLVLEAFMFFIISFIPIIAFPPSVLSQENGESDFQESLEEDPLEEKSKDKIFEGDPLAETESDLGLVEDPKIESGSDQSFNDDTLEKENLNFVGDSKIESDLNLNSKGESLEESDSDLGLGEDPFDETEFEVDLDDDPLPVESDEIEQEETSPNFEKSGDLEEEIPPKVSFSHEVKTMIGGSETKGLSVLDPLLSAIKELRFVSTYDQSVKVQTSPQMYNYFRLSISFSQNYELRKKRIFDGFASVREIYSNYRVGSHQIRYGTQIFDLGKVDLDKVIDVLHMNNIMGLYTFDPDDSKDAIPSIRYNWFHGGHTATVFISPIRQQTFGMRFTEFREEVEKKEEGNDEEDKVSFLRDYFGFQYQWTGDIMDTRFGIFHWFDSNPYIKLEYQKAGDNDTSLKGSFENMLSNYNEQESRSDFLTLEIDATWTDMVWKLESGFFKKRNLYSYEIPEGEVVRLSTLRAPHLAFSTSFERTFPYFYWLMIYSHRKWYDVPSNSHVFLFENEEELVPYKRDLSRNQVSGVAVLKTPDNSLRITLLNYLTWPFKQRGFASLFTWERYKHDMELELKFFSLETEKQKMLQDKIRTNQIFLTYTQKFKAN